MVSNSILTQLTQFCAVGFFTIMGRCKRVFFTNTQSRFGTVLPMEPSAANLTDTTYFCISGSNPRDKVEGRLKDAMSALKAL